MNRREAVKSIAFASVATVFITSCKDKSVVDFLFNGKLYLKGKHKEYLAVISETFLPVSDLTELSGDAVEFILTMLNDCRSRADIEKFANGFEQYKLLMQKSKLRIKTDEPNKIIKVVEALLEEVEPNEELVYFINTTRDLSIQHLQSSEYYMTKHLDYEMIPAEYNPCLTIQP